MYITFICVFVIYIFKKKFYAHFYLRTSHEAWYESLFGESKATDNTFINSSNLSVLFVCFCESCESSVKTTVNPLLASKKPLVHTSKGVFTMSGAISTKLGFSFSVSQPSYLFSPTAPGLMHASLHKQLRLSCDFRYRTHGCHVTCSYRSKQDV